MRRYEVHSMKWGLFVLVLYGILLTIGSFVMCRQTPYPPAWVAVRDLSANRLLQSGDIAPRGEWHYLKRAIKKGEELQAGDLVSAPDVVVNEGELPLAVPVPREQVDDGSVNVGEHMRLCKENKPIEPVTILTVLCPPREGACLAIAAVASTKAADVAQAFKAGPVPTLQSTHVAPACK
jgi:hypothetical protein